MDRGFVKKRLFFGYVFFFALVVSVVFMLTKVLFGSVENLSFLNIAFYVCLLSVVFALCKLCASVLYFRKDDFVEKLTKYFSSGLNAYSFSRNGILFIFAFILFLVLTQVLGINSSLVFIAGIVFALLCEFAPKFISVYILPRIYKASKDSLHYALKLSLNSGLISSLTLCALAFLGIICVYSIYNDFYILFAFLLGVSFVALFNTTQHSTIKKACLDASSVVAKFDSNILKNDKRDPVLLLKGLSGTALEFMSLISNNFQSYVVIPVCAIALGTSVFNSQVGILLPVAIVLCSLFSNVIVFIFSKVNKSKNPLVSLYISCAFACILCIVVLFFVMKICFEDYFALYPVLLIGILCGFCSNFIGINYIYNNYSPAKVVANASIAGISTVLIQVLKESAKGIIAPVLMVAFLIVISFVLAQGLTSPVLGIFGICICALGFVCSFVSCSTIRGFGFAGASYNTIAETYEQNLVKEENSLYEIAPFANSLSDNYFNICAVFSFFILFIVHSFVFRLWQIDILNPYIMFSMIFGSLFSIVFCAKLISVTSKLTKNLALEAKNQFKIFPQILRYEMCPDFEKPIKIAVLHSLSLIVLYICLIIVLFMLLVHYFKMEAVGGFFAGLILPSTIAIFLLSTASNVLNSAKSALYDTGEELFILNSTHEAVKAVKDIIVPNLESLIKFLIVLALAIAPLFM